MLGLWLVIPTILLTAAGLWFVKHTLEANRRAASEAARAATAASDANQINRELFVATERPWVKVDVSIGGPLVYDVNGLSVTHLFQVTNVGRSPAVNVWVDPRIHMFTGETMNPIESQRQHLSEIRERGVMQWGFMLFPGDANRQLYTMTVPQEALSKARNQFNFAVLSVSGFVTYGFVVDRMPRVTSFFVRVERREKPRPPTDKQKRGTTAIFFDDGDMPADDLRLTVSGIEGEYAD